VRFLVVEAECGVSLLSVIRNAQFRFTLRPGLEVTVAWRGPFYCCLSVRPARYECHARARLVDVGCRVGKVLGYVMRVAGARVHAVVEVADEEPLQRGIGRVLVARNLVG
jgi:hypothetical protein